jgi:nitrite reductase (NADH) large subunit
VISVGEWAQLSRVQEAVAGNRRIWSWQLRSFIRTGRLWPATDGNPVAAWPDTAIICNCTGVTRGQIRKCVVAGCVTVAAVAAATNASSVCGSCRPLLQQMCADTARPEPVSGWRALAVTAGLALLLALFALLGPDLSYSESVRVAWQWDLIWRESLLKQVSGFTLLGLILLTLGLSLRKRAGLKVPGRFDAWRLIHTLAGAIALLVLAAHSGFRVGHNLNLLLMACFSGVLVAGSIFGGMVAFGHRPAPVVASKLKSTFGMRPSRRRRRRRNARDRPCRKPVR